jgi:hypothetical protein
MKGDSPFTGRKNATSFAAERAARLICKNPLDLAERPLITGYAVDSADPDTPMDRDDAISIEYKHDPKHGKVTVLHVTIADVAASIPNAHHKEKDNTLAALDKDAQTNGETMYFTFGISPMLPELLQDRLSLENRKERPGLTISVTLDKDVNIVHTEFSRDVIRTHCKSYQHAGEDITMHGHPLQQLSVVAKHVLKKKSSVTNLPYYDKATGMYTDSEGNQRHINIDELSAYTTVQGCMIAANEAAAAVMRDSNFLFRNHSYTPRDKQDQAFFSKDKLEESGADTKKPIQNKAEYSPECKGHFGLNASMYSHVTSPIRRFADLANQRMMHWAIDVVDETTDQIMKARRHNVGDWDRERIAHHVWSHATQLLGDVTEYKQNSGQLKTIATEILADTVSEIADSVPGVGKKTAAEICRQTIAAMNRLDIPYTQKELKTVATELNETLEKNKETRRSIGYSETEAWLNSVFPDTDKQKLSGWGAYAFSKLLEGAAQRGDNNATFASEVLHRLDTDSKTLVKNLHTLLVVAEGRRFGYWQILRKQAFQRLKDNSELGEDVFAYMQDMQKRHASKEQSGKEKRGEVTSSYILEATLLDEQQKHYPAALVVLSNNGLDYSASIIDKADTPEHARQSAILTFFRQYGSLHPHDTQYTPKLIDLALKRAKMKKGERFETLKDICSGYLDVQEVINEEGHERDEKSVTLTLTVTNPDSGDQIIRSRVGRTEEARDKAAKDILQDRRFHTMLTQCHHDMAKEEDISPDTGFASMIWAKSQQMNGVPESPNR